VAAARGVRQGMDPVRSIRFRSPNQSVTYRLMVTEALVGVVIAFQ
jgi:hypothetical protein